MHEWLLANDICTINILTKCDYISKAETIKKIANLEKTFGNKVVPFSAKTNIYKNDILKMFSEEIKN